MLYEPSDKKNIISTHLEILVHIGLAEKIVGCFLVLAIGNVHFE
jgi:hypothetical protein